MSLNEVVLEGELAGVETLRRTPAGIPLLHFRIVHRSRQTEAGHPRVVECEVTGVALGEAASALAQKRNGDPVRVGGFLSRKSRMSTQLILHVTRTD